jgi:hypothetical protein
MMGQQYYIIENGAPLPVSEIVWRIWTDNTARLKVRETHLVKSGTLNVWGKVLTYFTGMDTCPGAEQPYLWKTKLLDAAPFETWRHTSEEDAVVQHDRYVCFLIATLRRDGVELKPIEINLSETTMETT